MRITQSSIKDYIFKIFKFYYSFICNTNEKRERWGKTHQNYHYHKTSGEHHRNNRTSPHKLKVVNIKFALEYLFNTNYSNIETHINKLSSDLELKKLVKRQYRKRAKEVHPDLGGSEETFRVLNENYQYLLSNIK
jgi:hypothetical protein